MAEDVSPTDVSPADLDAVLALQLAVAWAGEGLCRPARLGWWRTDLVDEGAPDRVRTLFFWGFRIDEKLDERLAGHKRDGGAPHETLRLPFALDASFDRAAFESFLGSGAPAVKPRVVPGGRQIVGELPDALALRARQLAAALLPLADQYPVPFFAEADSR